MELSFKSKKAKKDEKEFGEILEGERCTGVCKRTLTSVAVTPVCLPLATQATSLVTDISRKCQTCLKKTDSSWI